MPQSTEPQSADSLLAELLPRIQAAPGACREDLRAALAHTISLHDDALRSSVAQLGERAADLRRIGIVWATARYPLDPLLDLVNAATEKTLESAGPSREAVIGETGGQIICAILAGFQQAHRWTPTEKTASQDRRLLAVTLLQDLEVTPAHRPLLAESYAIIAFRPLQEAGAELDMESVIARFALAGAPDALPFLAESVNYVLVPSPDTRHAAELAEKFRQGLSDEVSLAVTWRRREEVSYGGFEAGAIADIVGVSERPPGVYQLNDVLVEYAVLQEPSVASRLVKMLTPMTDQPTLLATLKAFIANNGNRSKAAADLKVHRSTLDYRLQRIEQLTGTDPTSVYGLQLLSLALTTHAVLRLDPSGPDRSA